MQVTGKLCQLRELGLLTWLRQEAQLKTTVLVIVFIALLLDTMLLSVVVPILPSYLYSMDQLATRAAESSTVGSTFQPRSNSSVGLNSTAEPPSPAPSSDSSIVVQNSSCTNYTRADTLLDHENVKVGVLLASKAAVQLITNPFIGPLTNRIGYHIPMFAGFCIMFLSTTLFAFSSSYTLLLLARSVQGVGGSCLTVAGLGMLASVYTADKERGRAMGIAFSGLALGLVLGAPTGSVMYQFAGKTAPFLFLAFIAVLGGAAHFLIFQPSGVQSESKNGTPLLTLLKDPYILIAAGAICFINQATAMTEAALPIWMMKTMCASKWQQGVVFLPESVFYLVASNTVGALAHKIGRWLCALFGMLLMGITAISYGFAKNIYHVMALSAAAGFSIGMVDSTMMTVLGHLVDLRHVPVYGSIYAIADVAVCIGFSFGPSVGGPIAAALGFPWLMTIIGIVNILYAPLCFLLVRPFQKQENLVLVEEN
ncbi:synaptic vesicular amine transporter-like [Myripristis murdjan]|uniref:synaptic vesicular amine transporter-like n=1 Tax=Myripristis murdjan TaxID=586833 RepID=UPI0011764647|nr:synaptic vesicular amine transporter-like [Myripristis murdjan]